MKIPKIAISAFIALVYIYTGVNGYQNIVNIGIGKNQIAVATAVTPMQRWQGLKGIKKMPKNYQGMFFIYDKEATRYFTMEGTLMNLDIVFINENRVITIIFDNVDNYDIAGKKPVIVSALAKYVLELPAGKAKEYGLSKGMQLKFDAEIRRLEQIYILGSPAEPGKVGGKFQFIVPDDEEEPPPPTSNGTPLAEEITPTAEDPITELFTNIKQTPKPKAVKTPKGAGKTPVKAPKPKTPKPKAVKTPKGAGKTPVKAPKPKKTVPKKPSKMLKSNEVKSVKTN